MTRDTLHSRPGEGLCQRCGYVAATLSVSACPACGGPVVAGQPVSRKKIGWLSLPPMRYQNAYVWFVFLSALDVMLTWTILKLGGTELNPLAAGVVGRLGLDGMIGFKFALVLFVVIMAEAIGRRRDHIGRKLAEWAVALTAIPVVIALAHLAS